MFQRAWIHTDRGYSVGRSGRMASPTGLSKVSVSCAAVAKMQSRLADTGEDMRSVAIGAPELVENRMVFIPEFLLTLVRAAEHNSSRFADVTRRANVEPNE